MSLELGDLATWASAVVSAVALVWAIRAYKASAGSLQVAHQGLQVERERDHQRRTEELRAQAALVAAVPARGQAWFEIDQGERRWESFPAVEVINRSDLPVYGVQVRWPECSGVGMVRPDSSVIEQMPWKPVIDAAQRIEGMSHLFDAIAREEWAEQPPTIELQEATLTSWERYGSCEIVFTDAAGRRWCRERTGVLREE